MHESRIGGWKRCARGASTSVRKAGGSKISVMEDTKPAAATAAVEEPNELNVRLLKEEKDDAAARIAARNLAQNVRDESSDFSRMRQVFM